MLDRGRLAGLVFIVGLAVAACEGTSVEGEYPNPRPGRDGGNPYYKDESIFGNSGLFFDTGREGDGAGGGGVGGGGVGVNGFLWRASLDTVSFMPVNSADPFGGVIITDWHSLPEAPAERFKMNVYVLGRTLRADGVRVAVFRQVRDGEGQWTDVAVADQAGLRIEDAILTRARQLRFDTLEQ